VDFGGGLCGQPVSPAKAEAAKLRVARFLRRNWVEILLPGAVGVIIWFAFSYR
jgi:hypothetical protein